jgi:hypothetical protein
MYFAYEYIELKMLGPLASISEVCTMHREHICKLIDNTLGTSSFMQFQIFLVQIKAKIFQN